MVLGNSSHRKEKVSNYSSILGANSSGHESRSWTAHKSRSHEQHQVDVGRSQSRIDLHLTLQPYDRNGIKSRSELRAAKENRSRSSYQMNTTNNSQVKSSTAQKVHRNFNVEYRSAQKNESSPPSSEELNVRRNKSPHSSALNYICSNREIPNVVTYEDDWESEISTESSIAYDEDDMDRQRHEDFVQDSQRQTGTYDEFTPVDLNAYDTEILRQRQAAIDNEHYRKQVNRWQDKSLSAVVKKICQLSGESLLIRSWLIFYWISQNIQYDIESFFSGHILHKSAEDVFTTGKAVCDGFGTIFQSMCKHADIPCEKIIGYAKGFGHSISQAAFSKTNHAWNAVRLGSSWYLVDSTWGEGHIGHNNENVKKLNPFYFLVPPEQLIFSHFPKDLKWQLLAKPISMNDFIRLPEVHSEFFNCRLAFVRPWPNATIQFNTKVGVAEILLQAPENIDFTSSIKSKQSRNQSNNSLAQYDGHRKIWQFLFFPEGDGFHELNIYCKEKGKQGEQKQATENYECAVNFGLQVSGGWHCLKKCPVTYSSFTERKCQIFEPLCETLVRGHKAVIHCRIAGAYCARLLLDDHWDSEVKLKEEIFMKEFLVPKSEVLVYVKFENDKHSSQYTGLLRYLVES